MLWHAASQSGAAPIHQVNGGGCGCATLYLTRPWVRCLAATFWGRAGVASRPSSTLPQRGVVKLANVSCLAARGVARRAAGRSPRREPWVNSSKSSLTLTGRRGRGVTRECCGKHRHKSVAPPGLGRWCSLFPTAHAVSYDLPPSGLRHQTQHPFARRITNHLEKKGELSHLETSPKHRMSHRGHSQPEELSP